MQFCICAMYAIRIHEEMASDTLADADPDTDTDTSSCSCLALALGTFVICFINKCIFI